MKYFFSAVLLASGVLAAYFFIQFLGKKQQKYTENLLFAVCCAASAVWSFGFGTLILQTDADKAYLCRAVGMVGTFLFLITAQMLVCQISGIRKGLRCLFDGISLTGIFIYFLTIQKDVVVYQLEEMGMTYYFKAGLNNNLYTIYSVVIAFDILFVSVYMIRRSEMKRIQAFGKRFLIVEIMVVFGMILDTVFPLLGISAIPGSTITQFWGILVLYHAVNAMNRSKINIANMSEFIYYSLAMPVLVFDADRKIQIMNDAAAEFLRLDRGMNLRKDIRLSRLFDIDEERTFAFAGKRRDVDAVCHRNQVYCSLAVSKIDDMFGDIIGYIVIVTDLSERIKAVQKLEEAIREAKAANQAKSTFLANMSHEIRTPMNVIIGFSELLLKMELDCQVREYVEDIKNASDNLLATINDILDISKIESGKMELVCGDYYAANLFHDVFLIIDVQAKKKGLDFQMKIDSEVPNKLFGDKVRIRGILINLLNNAVKYTQQGSVSLEVKVLEKNEDTAILEFKVSDTGDGIKEEEQGRLFESFSQVDYKLHYGMEGSGLGLAIVKGYVTLMKGDISVESVYGEGSVFTVVIDQKIADATPMDASYAKENENVADYNIGNLKISGVRVLVVDDNQVNLKVAGSIMKLYGLEADTASNGREAIELCRKNRYRMVFMDQMMPQMDGVEAMREIRKLDSYYDFGGTCRMIVLTANTVSGVRDELLAEGFDEYLGKPINFRRLEQLLAAFLPRENVRTGRAETALETDTEEKEVSELQNMLPEAEVSRGILNCGGQVENYLQILQMIYREGEGQLAELEDLQRQQDYADYTIKIHALKGQALNIGAVQVSDTARQLEKAGKADDTAYIDANTEAFKQEYRRLLGNIRSVLEHFGLSPDVVPNGEKTALEEAEVLQVFEEIRQCMEEFDYAKAAGLIRETGKKRLPEEYEEAFRQIEQWMDEAEEEKIQELIGRYVK